MRTARSWSVPRSVFLGRVVADGEALWTDEDRQYAMALDAVEQGACEGCGRPLSETTDPANRGKYALDDPVECLACSAAERDLTDWRDQAHFHSMKFQILKQP